MEREPASARYCRRYCRRYCYRYWPRFCRLYICRCFHRFCRYCCGGSGRLCCDSCYQLCPRFCRRLCIFCRRLARPRRSRIVPLPVPSFLFARVDRSSPMLWQAIWAIAVSFLHLVAVASALMPAELQTLREIAVSFLRLGTTAFGGPAAHIAMMEQEFVRRRGWLSHEEFLDMLGATSLIPGPNSTEMAIHIGHQRGGWKGLVVGGVCFIIPAMLIVMAAAWAYVRFGSLPRVPGNHAWDQAGHRRNHIAGAMAAGSGRRSGADFSRSWVRSRSLAAMLGAGPLTILFGAGIVTAATAWIERERRSDTLGAIAMPGWPGIVAMLKSAARGGGDTFQPARAFSFLPQGRRGALWERLRAARVSSD